MATIQVREIPEESYEVLRRRAKKAGQSLQSYMRDELVAMASKPTKQEAVDAVEAILSARSGDDPTPGSIVSDLSADRR